MPTTTRSSAQAGQSAISGRRVLVTGAAGFIGTALCRLLAQSGAQVHGTSRGSQESAPGIQWWQADFADPAAARWVLRHTEPDLVFHLASHVSGDRSITAVHPTVRDNLITTINLLSAACETSRPRVILAGSMDEPDPREPGTPPGSPYAAAKTAAGVYASLFHSLYHLPVVRLRIFMVYGPGQRDTTKLVPYVATSLLRGEQPRLSAGTRAVDWVYVDDVAAAALTAATTDDVDGQVLDVGSGELVTVRAVVDRITRLVGGSIRPEFGVVVERPLEHERVADTSRTSEFMDWRPTTSLDEGLVGTVDWYRAQQQLLEDK